MFGVVGQPNWVMKIETFGITVIDGEALLSSMLHGHLIENSLLYF